MSSAVPLWEVVSKSTKTRFDASRRLPCLIEVIAHPLDEIHHVEHAGEFDVHDARRVGGHIRVFTDKQTNAVRSFSASAAAVRNNTMFVVRSTRCRHLSRPLRRPAACRAACA